MLVRGMEGNPGDRIAEGVLTVAPPARHRVDIDALLFDLLPGENAWRQVQLLLREGNGAAILVACFVYDVIANGFIGHDQSAIVCRLTLPTCVK